MAGPGSGLGSSLGSAIETTYGTAVTPVTGWLPSDSAEIETAPVFYDGKGLRAGTLVEDFNDHVLTNMDAGGSIKSNFYYKSMARYVASLMGGLAVTPTEIATTGAYTITLPFASQWGQSLTLQQGIPWVNQTIKNWLLPGSKITEGVFECGAGSGLTAALTVDSQDRYEPSAAITSPVEPAADPFFAWQNMVVKIGALGSEAQVDGISKWSGSIKRMKANKRFNAGNVSVSPNPPVTGAYGIKDEPVDNGFADISGTLSSEYLNDTFQTYYLTQNQFSLIISFTSSVVAGSSGANNFSVTFAFPCCRFLKGDPTISGPDIVKPSLPYKVFNNPALAGTPAAATITIVSTESTL